MDLDDKAKVLRREYYRLWREKPENKEKIRKYTQQYWCKKALKLNQVNLNDQMHDTDSTAGLES